MKNVVSLKRDLGSLSETSWVYILSASESEKKLGILGEERVCAVELLPEASQFLIFFFFFLAHRILLATMSG